MNRTLLLGLLLVNSVRGEIVRWDTNATIPGTETILPLPGVDLDSLNLSFAELSHLDLRQSRLIRSDLSNARLVMTDFTDAIMIGTVLNNADLRDAVLTNANLREADLTGADLSGSWIDGARFRRSVAKGLTPEQIYTTASYQAGMLSGVDLAENDLSGWDFANMDLTGVNLLGTKLHGADFTNANLRGAWLTAPPIFEGPRQPNFKARYSRTPTSAFSGLATLTSHASTLKEPTFKAAC